MVIREKKRGIGRKEIERREERTEERGGREEMKKREER